MFRHREQRGNRLTESERVKAGNETLIISRVLLVREPDINYDTAAVRYLRAIPINYLRVFTRRARETSRGICSLR